MIHQLLFFIFAAICVAGAVNLLLQKHPIHSALSLILVMGSLAVLYLLLGAPFLALIQIIVYAGAIMVLFVFVIMLLNAGEEEHSKGSRVAWLIGGPASAAVAGIIIWTLVRGTPADIQIGQFVGETSQVAMLLFKDYLLPFEVTSVLILIAIMGAVVLARRER
jgi:NADH-quinone oxidoreductase subunit J